MIADSTGHIRFLSDELKILFWLKLSKLSPLCNVSVSACEPEDMGEEAEGEESTLDPQPFIAPSFTTSMSTFFVTSLKISSRIESIVGHFSINFGHFD